MKAKFQLRFLVGFLLAAGSLVAAVLMVRGNSAQFRQAQGEISKGLITSLAVQEAVAEIDDAEARKDAYLRGGDEEERREYGTAETKVTHALDRLEAMTSFDPAQRDRAEALRLYARVRMAELSAAVEAQRNSDVPPTATTEIGRAHV